MYTVLLEEYPQEPWALKGACRCCLRLGQMDKARALIQQALTLPLPDADLNLLTALVDCYDGRYQTAVPLLRQSLKQNGACPEAHAAIGVALAATGQIKEAQEEMKRALSLNPKLGDAYYNLARLSLRQKPTDHDTARVHYQNALRHGAAPDHELDALLAE
jgi:tetratricopeptide (TPR) repeat protein